MKIKYLALVFICLILLTGCLKRDDLENVDIYATLYPIKYITERLYGENSSIYSIYPSGVNVNEYELTDKLISDYSKASMAIFNGQSVEKDYVIAMNKLNNNLKIIDATMSIEYTNSYEEMWLDPLNFLMMVQNIKNGFKQYISNNYLKNEVEENYENLKIEVSNLDAKIKLMVTNATDNNIMVSKDLLKFLTKYDLNVVSLENASDKVISEEKKLIANGTIKYIYVLDNEELSDTITSLIEETGVEVLTFHTLTNLTAEEFKNGEDYLSIMNENIELLKQEIYE
jgi:zinc transport system substrate-binding protein